MSCRRAVQEYDRTGEITGKNSTIIISAYIIYNSADDVIMPGNLTVISNARGKMGVFLQKCPKCVNSFTVHSISS